MKATPDIWIYLRDETAGWDLAGLPTETAPMLIGVYVVDSSHVHICSMAPSVEALFVETVVLAGAHTDPGYDKLKDAVEDADQDTETAKYFSAYDFEAAPVIDPVNDLFPGLTNAGGGTAKFRYPNTDWGDLDMLLAEVDWGMCLFTPENKIQAALLIAWEDARCNAYF